MSESVFARHVVKAPKKKLALEIPKGPLLPTVVPPSEPKSSPVEKTLDWLINRWGKPSVKVRDIMRFGPNPIRDRKSAIATAKSLAASGWLAPLNTHRHDKREWQIVRGPSE